MATTAAEIMAREVLTVSEDASIDEAIGIMLNSRITGMPVVDKAGKMIGVVSELDLLAQISKSRGVRAEIYAQPIIFSRKVDAISEDTPLPEIIERFIKSKYRRLPVLDGSGKLIGIITRRDMMKVFYYRSRLMEDEE